MRTDQAKLTEGLPQDELSWDLLRDMTYRSANTERRRTLGWMIDVLAVNAELSSDYITVSAWRDGWYRLCLTT